MQKEAIVWFILSNGLTRVGNKCLTWLHFLNFHMLATNSLQIPFSSFMFNIGIATVK